MEGMAVGEEVTTRPKSLKRSKPPPYDPSAVIDGSSENGKSGEGVTNDGEVTGSVDTAVIGSGLGVEESMDKQNISTDRKESKVDGIAFQMTRDRDTKKDVKVDSCFGDEDSHSLKTKAAKDIKDVTKSANNKIGDDSGKNKKIEDDADNLSLIKSVMSGMSLEDKYDDSPNYYNWVDTYPQLKILLDNLDVLKADAKLIQTWIPWPEDHYTRTDGGKTDWTVFPFLHTFPATDISKSSWIQSTNLHCARTSDLLKQYPCTLCGLSRSTNTAIDVLNSCILTQLTLIPLKIPGIRTALFSRLGGETQLSLHTGWEDLANHVLRCHINIKIPNTLPECCGLFVNGETTYHVQDEILVFDDSKTHGAFNKSKEERIVLIVDILRPSHVPKGRAKGGHTAELDAFVSKFK